MGLLQRLLQAEGEVKVSASLWPSGHLPLLWRKEAVASPESVRVRPGPLTTTKYLRAQVGPSGMSGRHDFRTQWWKECWTKKSENSRGVCSLTF